MNIKQWINAINFAYKRIVSLLARANISHLKISEAAIFNAVISMHVEPKLQMLLNQWSISQLQAVFANIWKLFLVIDE